MKTLLFNNQEFTAEKIIKTDTNIIGKDINGKELFLFGDIDNFNDFSLKENQEFDRIETAQIEILNAKLLKDNANMQLQLVQQQKFNADLLLKIASLGGNANV